MKSSELRIVYQHNKPYGIRENSGFLLFFPQIMKYEDQENRYYNEIKQQSKLANFILQSLKIGMIE